MAKLDNYELDESISGSDTLLGTDMDSIDKLTKNFSISALAEYFKNSINSGADTVTGVEFNSVTSKLIVTTNLETFTVTLDHAFKVTDVAQREDLIVSIGEDNLIGALVYVKEVPVADINDNISLKPKTYRYDGNYKWIDIENAVAGNPELTKNITNNTGVRVGGVANGDTVPAGLSYTDLVEQILTSETPIDEDKLGHKVIPSNFDFENIPVSYANNIWLIQKVYDLNGANITIPVGVTLKFDGGKIINYGEITGDKTRVECGYNSIFDTSGTFAGTWDLKVCHLEWFGAIPDDVTNNTQAWISILKLINVSSSAHLKMCNSEGRYKIALSGVDSLEVDYSNTVIEGGKFFLENYHFIKYATNVHNFTIKDVDILVSSSVTGSNFNSGVITSSLGNLRNITYDNLTLKNEFKARSTTGFNMINFNYNVDNVPDGTTMDNLTIKNCDIYIHGRNAYPIHVHKKTNNLIIKNNKVGTYSDGTDQFNGIGFNPIAVYANSYNFSVDSNTVIGAGHSGIACSAAEKGSITNNQVYDALANSEAGIEVEYKVGHGNLKGSNEVKISGNHVENCKYGVFITERDLTTSPSYAPKNVQILGNTFKNCISAGIFMGIEAAGGSPIFADNPDGVLISNNIFQGDLTLHPTASAIVCYYGKNILISDNIIKDYRVGIWGGRHSNSKLSGMFKVSNNLITNCTNQAVFIETNTGEIDISNNQIKAVSDTAIKVNSSVDATTRLSICNNQIYDGNKGIEASAVNTPKGIAIGNFCENMTGRGFKIGIASGILSNNLSLNTASVDQFVSSNGLIVNNYRI